MLMILIGIKSHPGDVLEIPMAEEILSTLAESLGGDIYSQIACIAFNKYTHEGVDFEFLRIAILYMHGTRSGHD